jgi:hypothetical protein
MGQSLGMVTVLSSASEKAEIAIKLTCTIKEKNLVKVKRNERVRILDA